MDFEDADLHRRLDADGRPLEEGYEPPLSEDRLRGLYRDMRLSRHFDERMISLQRQGRVGTYASSAGQEGSQFGSMYALREDDWVFYQYREHGSVIDRGGLADYVRYWMGQEAGNATLIDHHVAPLNISIGSHVPHATGMAWASKLRGDDDVVVCHFGEGATSEGDFHEGANFAGVFDVPAVFVCNNNSWAISVPAEAQTASRTFAAKAEAYGFPGVRVDGMDPLATYEVLVEAVERARDPDASPPEGASGRAARPTLVEAVVPLRRPHDRRRSLGLPGRRGGRALEALGPDPAAGGVPPRTRDDRRRGDRDDRGRDRIDRRRRDRPRDGDRPRPRRPLRGRVRGADGAGERTAGVPPTASRGVRRRGALGGSVVELGRR